MKPHELKKQRQNKDEKEGGKQMTIKNQTKKRRKDNKTPSKKKQKGADKKKRNSDKKAIKQKEPKINDLTHELLASNLFYLVILQSFKYLFTDSFHVKFEIPLSLLSLPVHLITPLRTDASAGLRWICPNHLKLEGHEK
jgi:hypothetical protein